MSLESRLTDLATRVGNEIKVMRTPAGVAPTTVLRVVWNGSSWPARPTSRTDVYIDWVGGSTQPPGMVAGDTWSPEA